MSLPNLFWKTPDGTKSLLATPFKTEEEFEKAVFDTPELLGDIFLLKRQIRGAAKPAFRTLSELILTATFASLK